MRCRVPQSTQACGTLPLSQSFHGWLRTRGDPKAVVRIPCLVSLSYKEKPKEAPCTIACTWLGMLETPIRSNHHLEPKVINEQIVTTNSNNKDNGIQGTQSDL